MGWAYGWDRGYKECTQNFISGNLLKNDVFEYREIYEWIGLGGNDSDGRRLMERVQGPPALAGDEWSSSRPVRFTPGTHWIGGWVDPRAGLDDVVKRKFLTLLRLEPPTPRSSSA
jgi:hypothetical protein